jgi:hypothetical protein
MRLLQLSAITKKENYCVIKHEFPQLICLLFEPTLLRTPEHCAQGEVTPSRNCSAAV